MSKAFSYYRKSKSYLQLQVLKAIFGSFSYNIRKLQLEHCIKATVETEISVQDLMYANFLRTDQIHLGCG